MNTPTFSQKVKPTWLFGQVLLFLFTLSTGFIASAQAPTLTATTVLIAANGGAATTYDANNVSSANPDFNGANLGNVNIGGGTIVLTGGTATTTETGANTVSSVVLYYRVPAVNAAFSGVTLTQASSTTTSGSTTRTFSLSASNQNLLSGITTAGTYNVDVYLQASYSDGTSSSLSVTDNNGGKNYVATFTVTGTSIVNTVWTGATNDNWFESANWTSGVPSATNDATIRNLGSNSPNPYPNIYSDAVKPVTPAYTIPGTGGAPDVFVPEDPGYDNSNSGNAMVRNLFMEGSSSIEKSILRLVQGRLDVFGDFTDLNGSFVQRAATTISFKAAGNQTISGAPNGLVNVEIDGGATSIKTLTNNFRVVAGGSLKFINGILQTTAAPSVNYVDLEDATGTIAGSNYVAPAQLMNESEASYLRGYLRTSQVATVGNQQNFSGIGISLLFAGNEPGQVTVNRTTNDNNTQSAFGGAAPSIRRVFQVLPSNRNATTGGLTATVTFNYLDNELVNLKTDANTYNGRVEESKLSLFVSDAGGNSYSQLGHDGNVDFTNNILTKSDVTTFGFFTLSEQQTPLPVELIAFNAKRSGANALVTWATAREISNSGFEVQVSTDGINFSKVAFVASQAINSSATLQYSYLDEEKGKYGTRYYRLRQLDQDGSSEYSPVRAVTFSGSDSQVAALSAYPNPYNANEAVKLSLATSSVGTASLRVSDLMGREVARQSFTTVNGLTEVALDQATKLSAGTYMVQVVLPSGEAKTVRIQKH